MLERSRNRPIGADRLQRIRIIVKSVVGLNQRIGQNRRFATVAPSQRASKRDGLLIRRWRNRVDGSPQIGSAYCAMRRIHIETMKTLCGNEAHALQRRYMARAGERSRIPRNSCVVNRCKLTKPSFETARCAQRSRRNYRKNGMITDIITLYPFSLGCTPSTVNSRGNCPSSSTKAL